MKKLPFDIIYEDNHLLVVNKPAGLLTQPTNLQEESLETLLKQWLKETYHKPGNAYLGVVHRLDRPVSGIVIFAKTSKALSRLNASIRSREMQKTYCALVEGSLTPKQGTLEHYLKHDDYRAFVSQAKDPEAKLARLHYQVLKAMPGTTLVEIQLETGRYHQIRAQFAALGHPIVGDKKYGSRQQWSGNNIALHHFRLEITHPVTKEVMYFEAPLPEMLV